MLLNGNAFPEMRLVALLSLAVGLDLLGVFFEADGEAAVAGASADEVEVIGLCGVRWRRGGRRRRGC